MSTDTTPHTTPALPLRPGRWALDPYHSAVGFTVRHLGISKVRGRFARLDAELVVGQTAGDCTVAATVAMDSIDTGNAMRDEHVRGPGLLDVERRPTLTFRSTLVRGHGQDWSLDGELTIGGVTRSVTFEVDFGGLEHFEVDGSRHAGFEATGEIHLRDFGLDLGRAGIGNAVKLHLDVQFVEPE